MNLIHIIHLIHDLHAQSIEDLKEHAELLCPNYQPVLVVPSVVISTVEASTTLMGLILLTRISMHFNLTYYNE